MQVTLIKCGELINVSSVKEASETIRNFIEANDLRASTYSGGALWDGNELIGRVAFNGRVFATGKWTPETKCLYSPYEVQQ